MKITEFIKCLKAFPSDANVSITGDHKGSTSTAINRIWVGNAYDINLVYDDAEEWNFGTKPFSLKELLDKLIKVEEEHHNSRVEYSVYCTSEEENEWTGGNCHYEVDSFEYEPESNTVFIWRDALNRKEAREMIDELQSRYYFYAELIEEFKTKQEEINSKLEELHKIQ